MDGQPEKILIVDDDENVLSVSKRKLGEEFQLKTASNGQAGLDLMAKEGPFAVVISDHHMPGMSGEEFLTKVRSRHPDVIRIMLTGDPDLKRAVWAVNDGSLFRFMIKPCSVEEMKRAIEDGLRQFRLLRAERELLEKTLNGTVQLLVEMLSLIDPQEFARAIQLRDYAEMTAHALGMLGRWDVEIAAMLSGIGRVAVPDETLAKVRSGRELNKKERELLDGIPEYGFTLLEKIPRLESVARIVRYQNKGYDGSGPPPDKTAGEEVPQGARILKALSDLIDFESKNWPKEDAVEEMQKRKGLYDPTVLNIIAMDYLPYGTNLNPDLIAPMEIDFSKLQVGDLFLSNVETKTGRILVGLGVRATQALMERLRNYQRLAGLKEPFRVGRAIVLGNA